MTDFPLILQLDVTGTPQSWINYEQACFHEAKGNVAWSMGAAEYDVYGGTCAKTGERSKLTINTIVAIKGKPNKKAMVHYNKVPLTNKTLFRRDHNLCAYCNTTYPSYKLTRDHIHPTSKGGRNNWMNVVTSCSPCNKIKDDNMLVDTSMELSYIPYVPNRAEWLILLNRKILADQMDFLINKVPKESRLLYSNNQ